MYHWVCTFGGVCTSDYVLLPQYYLCLWGCSFDSVCTSDDVLLVEYVVVWWSMFELCSKLHYVCKYKLLWLMEVHLLLNSSGLSCIWSNQVHFIESFKCIVRQRLRDQFIQEWQSRVAENSVCCNYHLFKNKFCFEKYLTYLSSTLRQRVLKCRLSNHRLPIQQKWLLDKGWFVLYHLAVNKHKIEHWLKKVSLSNIILLLTDIK